MFVVNDVLISQKKREGMCFQRFQIKRYQSFLSKPYFSSSFHSFSSSNLSKYLKFYNLNNYSKDYFLFSILSINSFIFLLWRYSEDHPSLYSFLYRHFTLKKNDFLKDKRFYTLLTSTVSHQSLSHLLSNMITLYFFGSTALSVLTISQFSFLYFGGCLIGSIAQIINEINQSSIYHRYRQSYCLGASAGVMSILTWSIITYPTNIIMIYFIIPVPAALFGILYVGNDVLGYLGDHPGVGYIAHLAGTIFGAGSYFLFKHKNKIFRRW